MGPGFRTQPHRFGNRHMNCAISAGFAQGRSTKGDSGVGSVRVEAQCGPRSNHNVTNHAVFGILLAPAVQDRRVAGQKDRQVPLILVERAHGGLVPLIQAVILVTRTYVVERSQCFLEKLLKRGDQPAFPFSGTPSSDRDVGALGRFWPARPRCGSPPQIVRYPRSYNICAASLGARRQCQSRMT